LASRRAFSLAASPRRSLSSLRRAFS
jgi:hypothetical protein